MSDDRPQQDTPAELVARLLENVRGQFCGDMTPKQWAQHSHFIRRNVILWPARFVKGKGFTLPADRYEQILLTVFAEIKTKGNTWAVKFWPGYLMKCVQDHWHHHWEEYYQEAKSARALFDRALLACKAAPQPADHTIEALAQAAAVLGQKRAQKRPSIRAPKQSLLGL